MVTTGIQQIQLRNCFKNEATALETLKEVKASFEYMQEKGIVIAVEEGYYLVDTKSSNKNVAMGSQNACWK